MRGRAILSGMVAAWLLTLSIAGEEPAAAKAAKQVSVVIDYGDGMQKHFTSIAWKEGQTVLDAMNAVQKHPRGIRFEFKGSGASAMLTKIDDLANEGRGRNWMYRINGKRGESSFGIRELADRDSVLWKFE